MPQRFAWRQLTIAGVFPSISDRHVVQASKEKASRLPIVLCAAAAAADTPSLPRYGVDAPRPNAWNGVIYAPTPVTASADEAHRNRLIALRQEAIDQQARDGGTLTAEHRADLQQKLDRIQLRYAEIRRRADAFAVDANGQALYSANTRPRIVTPPEVRTNTRYR